MVVADHVINDSEPHATEVLTPEGVLEHSSNVGATNIAMQMGELPTRVIVRERDGTEEVVWHPTSAVHVNRTKAALERFSKVRH